MTVRFYECRGSAGLDVLLEVARAAAAAGQTTRMLQSLDEPDLYLLTAEGPGAGTALRVPAGCRTWAFNERDEAADLAEEPSGATQGGS